jgi:hypothetical protein
MIATNTAAEPAADSRPFIARWRHAGGSERANYPLFNGDLCALLAPAGAAAGARRSMGAWPDWWLWAGRSHSWASEVRVVAA